MTKTKTATRYTAPIDVDGEFGTFRLAPAVVQPVARHGQVIPEGSGNRGELKSRTHDAADEERKSAMRAFFRTACAEGLDCKAAERMRREIATGEWIELQTALLVSLAW